MQRSLPMRNIGVTGFTSVEQIKTVQDYFVDLFEEHEAAHKKENSEPRLMVGILISSKTINGILNKYPARYAKPEALTRLFLEAMAYNTLNLAHYNTDNPENLVQECEYVMKVVGPALHGFQLNVRWPEPKLIKELKCHHPELHILLHIGGKALSDFALGSKGWFVSYDTQAFMAKVAQYDGCLDEILLDPSGGTGQPLNAYQLAPLVRELMTVEGLGINVAGGLSAPSILLVNDLVPLCPYLGIDAEERLRNSEDDSLNVGWVKAYLKVAFNLFYPKEKL